MTMKWLFLSVMLTLAFASKPGLADQKSHDECANAFDACLTDCNTRFADDVGKRAACVPQCSSSYAACDAGVAYDKAKPWFEEKAQKTKKFFEDMIEDFKKENPEPEQPEGKSI